MAGALAYGTASVLQGLGARRAVVAGRGLLGIARQWPYHAGLLLDLGGWLLSLLALRRLPLFAVQAILAGSLAVTVVLAALVLHVVPRRSDARAIVVVVVALVALGAAAGTEPANRAAWGVRVALVAAVPALAMLAGVGARSSRSVVTGGVAGLAFAGAALCARAMPAVRGPAGLVTEPVAWALVAYGVIGMLAYAHALLHGQVGPVTASLWVTEIVVPALIGVAILGDRARPGWTPVVVLASTAAIGATIVLAASPAQEVTDSAPRTPTNAGDAGGGA